MQTKDIDINLKMVNFFVPSFNTKSMAAWSYRKWTKDMSNLGVGRTPLPR